MNVPPTEFVRVPHRELYDFVERACLTVDMPPDDAGLLAQLLTDNDLRGVFSHGTQQIATYARLMREGILNPNPNVHIAKETPVSTIFDGDGGLGYFPAYESTLATIEKAKQQGIAIGQSRNHGHFGAAGLYTRLMLGHDLIGLCHFWSPTATQRRRSLCHRRRWLTPFLYLARQQRTVDDPRLRRDPRHVCEFAPS